MKTYRVFVAWLLVALPGRGVHAEGLTDYFPPPESKGGWRSLLPENGPPDAAQKEAIRATAVAAPFGPPQGGYHAASTAVRHVWHSARRSKFEFRTFGMKSFGLRCTIGVAILRAAGNEGFPTN